MTFEPPIATIGFSDLQMQLRACEGTVEEVWASQDRHLQTARNLSGRRADVTLATQHRQEIWLRRDDGSEMWVPLRRVVVLLARVGVRYGTAEVLAGFGLYGEFMVQPFRLNGAIRAFRRDALTAMVADCQRVGGMSRQTACVLA